MVYQIHLDTRRVIGSSVESKQGLKAAERALAIPTVHVEETPTANVEERKEKNEKAFKQQSKQGIKYPLGLARIKT